MPLEATWSRKDIQSQLPRMIPKWLLRMEATSPSGQPVPVLSYSCSLKIMQKKKHSFAGISPYLLYKLQISPYVVFFFMRRRKADVILNSVLFSKYVEYCS